MKARGEPYRTGRQIDRQSLAHWLAKRYGIDQPASAALPARANLLLVACCMQGRPVLRGDVSVKGGAPSRCEAVVDTLRVAGPVYGPSIGPPVEAKSATG
jgi:hypothetical protein